MTEERTPKGKVSPPDPVTLSWSGLKRWENCPQHQLRVIRHETEKQDKGRIFLPGTVCDLVQRRWLDSDSPQPGQMVQMVEDIFKETVELGESKIHWKGNPVDDQNSVKGFCRDAVTRLEPWLLENVIPYDYAPEVKFRAHMEVPTECEGQYGPVKLIGGIDIVVRDDSDKFRLYDLKITKAMDYIKSTLAQLTFYDLAWGVIQGDFYHANAWGFVTPMLDEPLVSITVGRDDRKIMLSRIIKYAQGVWANSWDPKADDTGCAWCEAKGYCDKFKTIAIVDENNKMKVSFNQAAAQRSKYRENKES